MQDPLDQSYDFLRIEDENNTLLDMLSTIRFNYVALQHGMSLSGIMDDDLRSLVEQHHVTSSSLEEYTQLSPAEQYRRYIESTPYAFALEGAFEGILDWSAASQVLFCLFFPPGIILMCLGIIDRIRSQSQAIEKARKKLEEEGFYDPNAAPKAWIGREAFTEQSMKKYQAASVKAYPAKQLLTELEASYALMRTFCDGAKTGTQIKLRQIIPSLKKLGYDVDENRGKIRRNPELKEVRGTMAELGYGDPNLIKQIFVKTTPHTDLLPEFKVALEKIQKEQADKTGIMAKFKSILHIGSREEMKPQDKVYALVMGEALKATLAETELLFRMSLTLLATVEKFG